MDLFPQTISPLEPVTVFLYPQPVVLCDRYDNDFRLPPALDDNWFVALDDTAHEFTEMNSRLCCTDHFLHYFSPINRVINQ